MTTIVIVPLLLITIIVTITFLSIDTLGLDYNYMSSNTSEMNKSPSKCHRDFEELTEINNQSGAIMTNDSRSKPRLSDLEFTITEFGTDKNPLLLYPIYNNKSDSIWIGDTLPGSGRFFEFDLSTKNYTVHNIEDANLITFSVVDNDNQNVIWYVDPTQNMIGKYDVISQEAERYESPIEGVISGLATDESQNLWVPVMHANKIVKFNTINKTFEGFEIPSKNSIPLNIIYDKFRNYVWFTESAVGKIGRLDLTTDEIKEYYYLDAITNSPFTNDIKKLDDIGKKMLAEPTVLFLNPIDCNIYISDHERNSIFSFNPTSEEFKEYPLDNKNGLAFGITVDNKGYLWVAEHIDAFLSVIDLETGENIQVKIPSGSYVQYIISDREGNVWFAEQGYDGLGTVS